MTKTTYIYALIDPRDKTKHYIGKTVQNPPQKRLRQHLQKPATDDLAEWVDELKDAGVKPEMEVLESVPPDADWRAAEIYWIRYGLSQNWYLTNRASGGDNYPLEALARAKPDDVISRIIYADEATLSLLTSINAFVMRGKRVEDNRFRDLFHQALEILSAENTDAFDTLKQEFHEQILSHGIIQMGQGWRVPPIKKRNPIGGEFFTVGKPFTLNGISLPGKWDKAGWRVSIKVYKKTSDLLDNLATEMLDNQRRGYDSVLQNALNILAEIFDGIKAM